MAKRLSRRALRVRAKFHGDAEIVQLRPEMGCWVHGSAPFWYCSMIGLWFRAGLSNENVSFGCETVNIRSIRSSTDDVACEVG